MDIEINEKGIVEIRALTMSKSTFKQIRELDQKAYREAVILGGNGESADDPDFWNMENMVGYVIEESAVQSVWFVFKFSGTICKIRDREIFFLLRSDEFLYPTDQLRNTLPQIFTR